MFASTSLRSLNEVNARPKRTSYATMSTWFFMDPKEKETNSAYLNIDEFETAKNYKYSNDLVLPEIPNNDKPRSGLSRDIAPSPVVREFLMKNWTDRRQDSNKIAPTIVDWRKGRSGSGGVWPNITQAFRENGSRLLFIEGPSHNRGGKFNSNENIDLDAPKITDTHVRKTYSGRKLTTAYKEKLERERMGVQTKHGVDSGNWNLMR